MQEFTQPPDLEAYFSRIGYTGDRRPTLATLHALTYHHACAIPWENLDVLLGRPIDLAPTAVEHKLVRERRGGYCFEQNQLVLHVLQALGFTAVPLSGRVRWQRPPELIPPRTHLFVRIELEGESWITDLGMGSLSLTAALRLTPQIEQATPHDRRRLLHAGGRYLQQIKLGADWVDVNEFTGEEMPSIDREVANWWACTNPNSKFRQNLMVGRAGPNGTRRTLQNQEFTLRHRDGRSDTRQLETPAALLEVLATEFDLHFPAETRFGPPGSPWPT